MNEQEARTIAAQATGTLVAQYAEAVQLGENWVVIMALNALPSDGTATTHQMFTNEEEWRTATYMQHPEGTGAHAIYSPSQKIAVLYIDNKLANTNTLHFKTMPTRKEVTAWLDLYMNALNARINIVLAAMYANGIAELATK